MKTITLKNKEHTKHKQNPFRKQMGFFDFGLGLALLAIFGGTAVVVTPDHEQEITIVEQQIQLTPADMRTEITVVQSGRDE